MANESADNLGAPLRSRSQRQRFKPGAILPRRLPWTRATFGIVLAILAIAALRIMLVDDADGGRPSAEIGISTSHQENSIAGRVGLEPEAEAAGNGPATITPLEAPAGSASGPLIKAVDDDLPDDAIADIAMPDANGIIPDLVEETQYGPIPRVGAQGQTPFAAYSQASITPAAEGKPMIAIMVNGLGLNEASTKQAINTLPDNITLAFAPYGDQIGRLTAAARSQGHELFLQLPMEPFDYPDNDPGPETLLTGRSARANLEHLFWLMARFGGYAGVTNYMGGRFTASNTDFTPIMEELGTRGLGYIDDGASNRSLAEPLASRNKVPFGRAAAQLDTNPARAPILAELDALEASARANGKALGIISALPVSIQTVAEWSANLEARGIVLVPASALMSK